MIHMQQRRDTEANWITANPILPDGEIAINKDLGQIKIGDGVTAWNDLDYFVATGTTTNFAATTDPGEEDTSEYAPGSLWYNTAAERLWVCIAVSEWVIVFDKMALQFSSVTSVFLSSSTSWVPIDSSTITASKAGICKIEFNASFLNSSRNANHGFRLTLNGTAIAGSEREISTNKAGSYSCISLKHVVDVDEGDIIAVEAMVDRGILRVYERCLIVEVIHTGVVL